MQKQAPTVGRLLVMVGFALSCFGLLLFLWLAFGGPIPLKPKGYRFHASFGEATQLAKEADVRISGVSVGKVKTIETDKRPGAPTRRSSSTRSTRRCRRTRKAILRQKTLLGETYVELTPGTQGRAARSPRTATLAGVAGVADRRARRDLPRVRPADARGVPDLDADAGAGIKGRGQDINDALGNLAPFAEDTNELLRDPQLAGGRGRASSSRTPASSSTR